MHCDRRDIARWKRKAILKKKIKRALKKIPTNFVIAPAKVTPHIIRVIKKDGTVILIEKKIEQEE